MSIALFLFSGVLLYLYAGEVASGIFTLVIFVIVAGYVFWVDMYGGR
ncbi:MAG: hypothetical protein WC553_02490 [Patescibacteria group bacterium]|jgi:uncharacterized membrane-anchored protein